MPLAQFIILLIAIIVAAWISYDLHKNGFLLSYFSDENAKSQKELDDYIKSELTGYELGRLYERFIGYTYESQGYEVEYHGAVKGSEDLGRDLIVITQNEVFIIQTKYWAKYKTIHEKHIFQLYGSLTHFKLTENPRRKTKALFYTSANYSEAARQVAQKLGIELKIKKMDKTYPMIKCNVSYTGEKNYHLPTDPYYDKIKIEAHKGEFYARTVKEALAKGFQRAKKSRAS